MYASSSTNPAPQSSRYYITQCSSKSRYQIVSTLLSPGIQDYSHEMLGLSDCDFVIAV